MSSLAHIRAEGISEWDLFSARIWKPARAAEGNPESQEDFLLNNVRFFGLGTDRTILIYKNYQIFFGSRMSRNIKQVENVGNLLTDWYQWSKKILIISISLFQNKNQMV